MQVITNDQNMTKVLAYFYNTNVCRRKGKKAEETTKDLF